MINLNELISSNHYRRLARSVLLCTPFGQFLTRLVVTYFVLRILERRSAKL